MKNNIIYLFLLLNITENKWINKKYVQKIFYENKYINKKNRELLLNFFVRIKKIGCH